MPINTNKYSLWILFVTLVAIIAGCESGTGQSKANSNIPRPIETVKPAASSQVEPHISNISLTEDSSYLSRFQSNPYSQLTSYTLEAYSPDQDLYNFLFEAALERKDSVDISSFALTPQQIMDTASSMYEQAGMHLYYLSFVKWSKDYKTIRFQYNDSDEHIAAVQSHYYEQMNHLLHNVAPEHYSEYQRFFAVYDYIARHADYSDDINDPTTHTAHSILTKNMGICGGFAALTNLVLNEVGVYSEYVSNVAHAWNIVELGGERYHADVTWGAGYKQGNESSLNHALMNDERRSEGLIDAGLNDDPTILGFPRVYPVTPEPVSGTRFDFLAEIYGIYALDIEKGWIYFSLSDSIERIKLDGTGRETVWNEPAYNLAYYNDTLYFSGTEPTTIYKMKDGAEPIVLDQSNEIYTITIHDGILYYGDLEGNGKELDLNFFSKEAFNHFDSIDKPLKVQAGGTYSLQIEFDAQMNTEVLPQDFIGLVTKDGNSLPLHMYWSDNGKMLTVRSKSTASFESNVSLYVAAGIESAAGSKTTESRMVQIEQE